MDAVAALREIGMHIRTPDLNCPVRCGESDGECSHETVVEAVISCVIDIYNDCGAHGLFKRKMRMIADRHLFRLDNAEDYLVFCILLSRGLLEYGGSLRTGWLTDKGQAVLALLEQCPEEE